MLYLEFPWLANVLLFALSVISMAGMASFMIMSIMTVVSSSFVKAVNIAIETSWITKKLYQYMVLFSIPGFIAMVHSYYVTINAGDGSAVDMVGMLAGITYTAVSTYTFIMCVLKFKFNKRVYVVPFGQAHRH